MKSKHKDVSFEDVKKAFGPELMEFLAEALHTAVHEDHIVPEKPVDGAEKRSTS